MGKKKKTEAPVHVPTPPRFKPAPNNLPTFEEFMGMTKLNDKLASIYAALLKQEK